MSVSLASLSVCVCLYVWGQLSGLEKGYFYGVFIPAPQPETAVYGHDFYQTVNIWYCFITAGFCVYAAGRLLLSNAGFSNAVCILALSVGLYPFRDMFIYKKGIIDFDLLYRSSSLPYFQWLKLSVYFDWFLLSAALILLIAQVILMITSGVNKETIKIN